MSQPSSSTSIVSQSASSKTVRGDRQSESKAKSQSEQESNDKTPSFSTSKKKKWKIGSLSQKKSLSAVSGSDQEAGPTTTKQPKLRTFSSRWLTEFFWLENRDGYMFCTVCVSADSSSKNAFVKGEESLVHFLVFIED